MRKLSVILLLFQFLFVSCKVNDPIADLEIYIDNIVWNHEEGTVHYWVSFDIFLREKEGVPVTITTILADGYLDGVLFYEDHMFSLSGVLVELPAYGSWSYYWVSYLTAVQTDNFLSGESILAITVKGRDANRNSISVTKTFKISE
jgi:hypothetical protein